MINYQQVFDRLDSLSRHRALTDRETDELCRAIQFLDRSKNVTGRSKPQNKWTDYERDQLCEYISQGISFANAGKQIGRTKNSCIGQWREICAKIGWQAQ